jgi:nucleoid DNA-binding protein
MSKVCKSSDWLVKLRAKSKPLPKASGTDSELSDKVNMQVDIKEDETEDSETTDVTISVEKEDNERLEISLNKKKKTRFKAGSDLTEKVNVFDVDLIEESDEDSEVSKLKMKLQTNEKEVLQLSVRKKRKPQFKAGADLTDKVNLVAVDWMEEITDEQEIFSVSIKMNSGACTLDTAVIVDSKLN